MLPNHEFFPLSQALSLPDPEPFGLFALDRSLKPDPAKPKALASRLPSFNREHRTRLGSSEVSSLPFRAPLDFKCRVPPSFATPYSNKNHAIDIAQSLQTLQNLLLWGSA